MEKCLLVVGVKVLELCINVARGPLLVGAAGKLWVNGSLCKNFYKNVVYRRGLCALIVPYL